MACNGLHIVEQRCRRWLLAQDGLGTVTFPLAREFPAAMLGVWRTGVTEVASNLQRAELERFAHGWRTTPAGLPRR